MMLRSDCSPGASCRLAFCKDQRTPLALALAGGTGLTRTVVVRV